MDDLIEALTLMRKLAGTNVPFPTHCEHDVMYVFPGFNAHDIDPADAARLGDLGFFEATDGSGGYMSFKYGSC